MGVSVIGGSTERGQDLETVDRTILLVPALLSDSVSHPSCWVLLAIRVVVICWWKSFVCV